MVNTEEAVKTDVMTNSNHEIAAKTATYHVEDTEVSGTEDVEQVVAEEEAGEHPMMRTYHQLQQAEEEEDADMSIPPRTNNSDVTSVVVLDIRLTHAHPP